MLATPIKTSVAYDSVESGVDCHGDCRAGLMGEIFSDLLMGLLLGGHTDAGGLCFSNPVYRQRLKHGNSIAFIQEPDAFLETVAYSYSSSAIFLYANNELPKISNEEPDWDGK